MRSSRFKPTHSLAALLPSLLLAGCVDDSATYYIDGNHHALTVRAVQAHVQQQERGDAEQHVVHDDGAPRGVAVRGDVEALGVLTRYALDRQTPGVAGDERPALALLDAPRLCALEYLSLCEGALTRATIDGLLAAPDEQVGEEGQVLDVVEVGVGDDDVVDQGQLIERQGLAHAAGVEGEDAVDKEAGCAAVGELAAVTPQDA